MTSCLSPLVAKQHSDADKIVVDHKEVPNKIKPKETNSRLATMRSRD